MGEPFSRTRVPGHLSFSLSPPTTLVFFTCSSAFNIVVDSGATTSIERWTTSSRRSEIGCEYSDSSCQRKRKGEEED